MLQKNHVICWLLKLVEIQLLKQEDSCHLVWHSQSYVETIITCKFLLTYAACAFTSTDRNIGV